MSMTKTVESKREELVQAARLLGGKSFAAVLRRAWAGFECDSHGP